LSLAGKTIGQTALVVAVDQVYSCAAKPAHSRAMPTTLDPHEIAQSTIDALSSTICVLNETGTIIAVNRAWKSFAKANRRDPHHGIRVISEGHDHSGEGANYLEVCDRVVGSGAAEAAEFAEGIRAVLRGESELSSKEYPCHSPGEKRWFLGRVTRFFTNGLPRVVIEHIDITARKQSEALLRESAERLTLSEVHYRTIFQTSLDCISITRLSDGKIIDVNNTFLDVMGYKLEEVVGRTSLELNIWADPKDRQNMVEVTRQCSSFRDSTVQFRKGSGEIFWVLQSASVIEIQGDSCLLGVFRDISGVKAAENEIRDLAFYDPLTHLPNRRLLMDRLRQTLVAGTRSNRNKALLLVGLDNFKTLNDALGHQTGDLLLQEVVRRLISCVRETDTVARLGGDEFVMILEDLSETPEDAAALSKTVGEKILAAIGKPFLLDGHNCLSTSSIGITVFGNGRESAQQVLQQADIAMHQAKAAGRNTICFFAPALQTAVNTRAQLEDDIRQAIETRQFELYYQPQVERGHLIGAEALLRWNHPTRGLLAPAEFIALAESTGLILPLGDWVLETACQQIAAWANHKETAEISVAVNISGLQLRQPDFVEAVLAVLDRTGANPHNLDLELIESMLVENVEDVVGKMTKLKSHGVRFSVDDFGTGYSSLAYLKRLPLDQLKIDRSFVRDILIDGCSGTIAQTIISLGRAMGLSVIAEGVETEEQRDFLARLGCKAFQGYLCSRPLPLENFMLLALRFAGSRDSTHQ
jgi:diguanylate cyclase (GGDEF)-like protein/PAS domain S-box-containing protein